MIDQVQNEQQAAYGFVDLMVPRADDPFRLMWYGWALREAFIAGAAWQEKSKPGYLTND